MTPDLPTPDVVPDEPVAVLPPPGSAFTFGDVLTADYVGTLTTWVWDLLYPGTVSCISGEPGIGKSWLAVAAALHVLALGGSVVVLDFEDVLRTWAARLRALMASASIAEDQLADVVYQRGNGAPTEADLDWLPRLVGASHDVLVIIDSVAEAMAAMGLDENSATDVTSFHQRFARPLADAGGTVLLLDHVTKNASSRGRWARGSGAKLAAITGVAYSLDVSEPFSRERGGTGSLVVGKDRHGGVGAVGEAAASVRFDVAGGGLHAVDVQRLTPTSHGDRGPHTTIRRSIPAEDF